MNKLFVDYEYVESTAAKQINSLKQKYNEQWKEVFNQFHTIDNNWDGVDNDEFNSKFASLQKDFEAMDTYLDKLYAYLIQAAQKYRQEQEDIKRRAQQLKS